jgi:predicted ABC-type ATPase
MAWWRAIDCSASRDDPESNSYEAAAAATQLREQLVQEGRNFCFETVFSHTSKIDFLAMAKARGYQIILVYIHLESSELNLARVAQRVGEGGHNVPDEKVLSRIPRTMSNVKAALPLCDRCRFYDNSQADNPMVFVGEYQDGQFSYADEPIPHCFAFFST